MTETRGISDDARLGWRVRLLLGCYPPWWRVCYDDEMRDTVLALRDEGRWSAVGARDLLRGLVSAWANPAAVPSGEGMPWPDRRLVRFAAWGLLLFVFGVAGFAKMLDYPEFTAAADQHHVLSWCVTALAGVAICTAVVVSAAALVALVALVRQPDRRWQVMAPLLAVPLSAFAFAVTLGIARRIADGPAPAHARQVGAFAVLLAVTALCGLVCTVAVMRTALQVPESRAVAVSRRVALVSVGALTTLAALSVLAWTLVAASQTPGLLRANEGLVSTPTLLTVLGCLAGLLSGAGLCLRATAGVLRPGGSGS
jgi:hypothetical protein